MKKILALCIFASLLLLTAPIAHAQTSQSKDFSLQIGITPTQAPFKPRISSIDSPMRLILSADAVDYGPMTPTNPIKRIINLSIVSTNPYDLFLSQNHPLSINDHEIPNTTCDNGFCNEKRTALWQNPFTFGVGFSLDDSNYQQFATGQSADKGKLANTGDIFIKVNIAQNQYLKEDEFYTNTLEFLLLPRL